MTTGRFILAFDRDSVKSPEEQIRHLLVIQDKSGRRTIPLEAGTYSIGRHPSNTIVLNSRMVSRQHAVLLRVSDPQTGNFFFRLVDGDLQGKRSANGLKVNGKACQSHILKHRDLIIFGGDVRARYHAISNLSDTGFSRYTHEAQFASLPVNARDSLPYQAAALDEAQAKVLSEAAIFRLSSFPELSPNPILEVDQRGQITYLNPAAMREFKNLQASDSQHPLLLELLPPTESQPQPLRVREIQLGDFYYEQVIQPLPEANLIRCYITNITERKLAQRALQESEERYAIAAEGANDGLWDWDLRTNDIYFSERWKQMLGLVAVEVPPTPEIWFAAIYADDRPHLQIEIEQHITGLTPHLECEFRVLHQDGNLRWMRVRGLALRDENNQPYRMAGSLTDITEYRLIQEQILHDALHDAMTGLPNRILMMDRLGQAIQRAKRRPGYLFAILFLDLDRFKVLNDSLGHLVGDQLLIGIAQRLVGCLRSEDTIARLGGDEFAILLDEVGTVEFACQVAERILAELRRPFILEGHEVFTGVSIGIAFNTHEHLQPEDLLRDADTAMYRAKSLGKDRYEVFSTAMRVEVLALLQLETELRRAVERGEFIVYYQPIVDLIQARICGFETLIRWQHPQRGVIAPGEFINIAEETGLILPMSWWVLETACAQMQQWSSQFPSSQGLSISVNLTGQHFSQPDLVSRLDHILATSQFSSQRLRLEVTETILMENTELAVQALEAIRMRGIQIYMDDFGTGYSSLSYLHRFPIDTLKIDRCFISPLLHPDIQGGGIVQTILTLAKSLHLNVVAEGVETEAQCLALQRMGCAYAQGYLFAPPLSTSQVEEVLARESLDISCLRGTPTLQT